jgi:hypothetical protein
VRARNVDRRSGPRARPEPHCSVPRASGEHPGSSLPVRGLWDPCRWADRLMPSDTGRRGWRTRPVSPLRLDSAAGPSAWSIARAAWTARRDVSSIGSMPNTARRLEGVISSIRGQRADGARVPPAARATGARRAVRDDARAGVASAVPSSLGRGPSRSRGAESCGSRSRGPLGLGPH